MRTNTTSNTSHPRISLRKIFLVITALVVAGFSRLALAQQTAAKTFASADEAVQALYAAVKNNDERAVQAILGAGSELTSSGDEALDKLEREEFVREYQEMHRLVREPDGSTVLYISAANYPFPVPLIAKNGKWRFDADAGVQEITARTIGENESIAIQICQDLAKAVQPDAEPGTTEDAAFAFARKLATTSPYAEQSFNGYKFRIGSEQSVGVVLVAYPVEYAVSGVMTFIVLPGGAIYEKDLGSETATLAPQINARPAGTWAPVNSREEVRAAN